MASKYQALRGKIPAFENAPDWQEKINAWKSGVYGENPEAANVAGLAAHFAKIKAEKDELEAQISVLNVGLEALSQMLVERLEIEEQQSVALSSGATVFLSYDPYPTVEDKDKMLEWLKKKKMSNLLTLNYQTLRGIVGDMLADGQPPPPGVNVFLKVAARVRKASKGDAPINPYAGSGGL